MLLLLLLPGNLIVYWRVLRLSVFHARDFFTHAPLAYAGGTFCFRVNKELTRLLLSAPPAAAEQSYSH